MTISEIYNFIYFQFIFLSVELNKSKHFHPSSLKIILSNVIYLKLCDKSKYIANTGHFLCLSFSRLKLSNIPRLVPEFLTAFPKLDVRSD